MFRYIAWTFYFTYRNIKPFYNREVCGCSLLLACPFSGSDGLCFPCARIFSGGPHGALGAPDTCTGSLSASREVVQDTEQLDFDFMLLLR